MKMEEPHKIQTPGNHPKERIQQDRKCPQINTLQEFSRKQSNHSENGNLGNHSNNGNSGDHSKHRTTTIFMTHVCAIIGNYTKQQ